MVKLGRRFFFNRTYRKKSRKNLYITLGIIGGLMLAVIIVMLLNRVTIPTINRETSYVLKDSVTVELNGRMPSTLDYFKIIENVPLNKISIIYDESFTYKEDDSNCSEEQKELISKIRNNEIEDDGVTDYFACLKKTPNLAGVYKVTVKILDKSFETEINVVDPEKPELELQDVIITQEQTYKLDDFVKKCTDNSGDKCGIAYYTGDEDVDYSAYKEPGEYEIKIVAYDKSGNTTDPMTAKLTITEIRYFTVTFNSDGGSKVADQTVRDGNKAYSTLPSKEGYNFLGWYYNGNLFNFNTPITKDITLVAKWQKKQDQNNNNQNNNNNNQNNNNNNNNQNNGCQYGKYSEFTGKISMYATIANGRKMSDCANSTNATSEYNKVYGYSTDIINNLTKKGSLLDQEIRSEVGNNVNLYFDSHISYVTNSKNGFLGALITIKVSVNDSYYKTYTLYNCSSSSCEWY